MDKPRLVRVQIAGPEHTAKTTLMVLIADYLETIGVNVIRQRADPQFAAKMAVGSDALEGKVHGMTVVITEMQTSS
jgi:hypothetical protein